MTAEPARPAVAIAGLSKRYGERLALDEVSLQVAPGQLRGLLGPNGAGKTTLLRILMRLIRPDAGTVTLLGRPLGGADAVPDRSVAGFVEEPAFYPYLSGAVNLELLAELDDGAAPPVSEVLDRVGLGDRGQDRVSGYSTGMRQRLGIAAALLRSPRVLLLDEPTSGLDPAGAQAVSVLLRELCDDGVAVLLSSHLIGELEALCDAYTVIRGGRVVWDGDASELEHAAPGAIYALTTSDDARAVAMADGFLGVSVAPGRAGTGALRLTAEPGALAPFVLALGREEVAVLRLELEESPLRTLFFSLTGGHDPPGGGP
ncbi:MAG TPA: ABC transporter ATP-binding protein [Solirubrobacteraceae bacterium]|nr:ABC transporter ATP-binding protein [Solirubrobacteraceae bacterium]